MSKKLKKVSESTLRQAQQQPKQSLRKEKSTKTVHILLNNLDQQIQQSYRKLKLSRNRNAKINDSASKNETSVAQDNSSTFDNSFIHKRTMSSKQQIFDSPFTKKTPSFAAHSQSILLDNQQLMEYINLVYQMYNINNPLQEEKEFITTGKKTVEKQVRKEIGSASTMKHSYIYQDSRISPFDAGEQSERIGKDKKDMKIKLTGSKVKDYAFENKQEPVTSSKKIRLKREDSFESHTEKRTKTQKEQTNIQITQTFRFCFMCEQPILQSNLNWHQKTCIPLQQAIAHKNLDQLIDILQEKIRKFRKQINLNLINKSEERVKEEFNEIRSTVRTWMDALPQQNITIHKRNISNGDSYRHSFTRIEDVISKTSWCSYEAIRKLQWFSKLKESIALKFFPK